MTQRVAYAIARAPVLLPRAAQPVIARIQGAAAHRQRFSSCSINSQLTDEDRAKLAKHTFEVMRQDWAPSIRARNVEDRVDAALLALDEGNMDKAWGLYESVMHQRDYPVTPRLKEKVALVSDRYFAQLHADSRLPSSTGLAVNNLAAT